MSQKYYQGILLLYTSNMSYDITKYLLFIFLRQYYDRIRANTI